MSPPHPRSETSATRVRRHAPLKSVSTRIILCVFLSTLLTALVVSWLSIGAIHQDVRQRTLERIHSIVEVRGRALEAWMESAATALEAAAAPGTAWHRSLMESLAALEGQPFSVRRWLAEDLEKAGLPREPGTSNDLPVPPETLSGRFDELTLRPVDRDAPPRSAGCLAIQIGLPDARARRRAELSGCLSRSALLGRLNSPGAELHGLRLLVIDAEGRVVLATGAGADARIGDRLPLADFLPPNDRSLADYRDSEGQRLVGGLAPLGQTGWKLAAEIEHARAFAPAIAITRQIFIVDVCIILLFSVLAYKITLAIMKPIEALSEGARRITEGNVDYQIPLPDNDDDELGLLTRTFNDMMEKLRNSQLEIEQDRLRLAEKNEELQRANEILSQLSITDGLTKLHNHRYFQDHLAREIKRIKRTKAPLSMILLDIDDFKLLNDTHGHAAGDEVLVSLASIMNDSARESDLIARYGGEEFVILMPNTDLAGAVHLAEKIRMAVESTRLIIGDGMKPIEITISLGVATFSGSRREFFAEADRALYQAKAAGKNCVIIAGSESPRDA